MFKLHTESSSNSSQRHTDSVESIVGLFNVHCYIMPMYVANMIPIYCFQDSAEDYHDKKHPDGANTLQTQQVLLQALFSCVSPSIWEKYICDATSPASIIYNTILERKISKLSKTININNCLNIVLSDRCNTAKKSSNK